MLCTHIICSLGRESKQDSKNLNVPINFYAYRLLNEQHKTYGFCVILQPIIIIHKKWIIKYYNLN